MKQSYLTAKLYEVLLANNLISYGDPFPTKNMTLTEFFDVFQKTNRITNVEAIRALKDVHHQDLFTSLLLDVPVSIYDEVENRVYFIVRNDKDVTIAVPVMMGLMNRYQIYSTDKKLAEELKEIGETVADREILDKLFDIQNRIEHPVINAVPQSEVVELAPKSQIETLLESGVITSVTRTPPEAAVKSDETQTTVDAANITTDADGNTTVINDDRSTVDNNNRQDGVMREHLAGALKTWEANHTAGTPEKNKRKTTPPAERAANNNHKTTGNRRK